MDRLTTITTSFTATHPPVEVEDKIDFDGSRYLEITRSDPTGGGRVCLAPDGDGWTATLYTNTGPDSEYFVTGGETIDPAAITDLLAHWLLDSALEHLYAEDGE